MRDDYASRSEVAALRRRVVALESVVAHFFRRPEKSNPDGRLGAILRMVFAFMLEKPWTAGELIEDARRGAPDLWIALDQITGSRGDPAVRLGRWLQRHDGAEADGLTLQRVRQECGAWTYRVVALA